MKTLVDTNVLLRVITSGQPAQICALGALTHLRDRGEELFVVPQIFYEFWVVATRPAEQNGLGLPASEVLLELARAKALFVLLTDESQIFPEWELLVAAHQVIGKNGHDARLVAAMRVHGISRLLTFNSRDFQRYSGIEILSPETIVKESDGSSDL
jgi:predicted nucleic acid-binding protein